LLLVVARQFLSAGATSEIGGSSGGDCMCHSIQAIGSESGRVSLFGDLSDVFAIGFTAILLCVARPIAPRR
jgi:hypothetical protein